MSNGITDERVAPPIVIMSGETTSKEYRFMMRLQECRDAADLAVAARVGEVEGVRP
jgi:hypothetical protein